MNITNVQYLEGKDATEFYVKIDEGNDYLHAKVNVEGDVSQESEDELSRLASVYLARLVNTNEYLHDLNAQQLEVQSMVREVTSQLNTVKQIVNDFVLYSNLTDEQMTEILSRYPTISVGETAVENSVYNINGTLYRAIQTVRIDDEAWLGNESLFVKFIPDKVDDTPIIADWVRPTGAHDAYKSGDTVRFDGKIYECIADNTVHSPSEYAQAWKLVE